MSTHDWDERGILTPADVEYLFGEADLAEGSEFNTRRRIRSRTLLGITDFRLLFEELSDRDREIMFDRPDRTPRERAAGIPEDYSHNMRPVPEDEEIIDENSPDDHILEGARDAMAFFYLGMLDRDEEDGKDLFERILQNAVKKAVERDGSLANVEVSIDVTTYDEPLQEIREKFLAGDADLTEEQKRALLKSDPDALLELAFETLGGDDENSSSS